MCGTICYDAFKAIAKQHNFPPTFPSPEIAVARMEERLAHPDRRRAGRRGRLPHGVPLDGDPGGTLLFPYRFRDESRFAFAQSVNAQLAGPRGKSIYSLSPASLLKIPEGARLVLPSPNGASLTLATGRTPTFAGCLRNSRAVAETAMRCGTKIAEIPAGERWAEDGSLRFAVEDVIGAGAIIARLTGRLSPEARVAAGVYQHARGNLLEVLAQCGSGAELRERGFESDIALAAQVDFEDCAPMLRDNAYIKTEQGTAPDGDRV